MNPAAIAWRAVDPALHRVIERALGRALENPKPLHETVRRSLYRASLDADGDTHAGSDAATSATSSVQAGASSAALPVAYSGDVVCKVFHPKPGTRAMLGGLKRRLGRSAARREYRALERASAKGLAVPRPLAYGLASSGEEILVTAHIAGRALLEVLEAADFDRTLWNEIVPALAASVRELHAAGLRHGDLHAGNLRLSEGRVFLFDFQRARRLRGERDRLADLAQLEFSLERAGASDAMCQALRAELQVGAALDAALIRFTRDHRRGRSRRRLRIGRDWQTVEDASGSKGVRLHSIEPGLVRALYAATGSSDPRIETEATSTIEIRRTARVRVHEIRMSGRAFVTKVGTPGRALRRLADRVRGSSGARAFRKGTADRIISDRAAPPLAYLDHAATAQGSWLLMERVGGDDLDRFVPRDAEQALSVARALGAWLASQHAKGLGHRDLKAGNIRIEISPDPYDPQDPGVRFWLVDLQDLTGPARVSHAARITALSQLNASLADDSFSAASRRAALDAYHRRLPFDRSLDTIRGEIFERSLARQHRFRGADCQPVPGR